MTNGRSLAKLSALTLLLLFAAPVFAQTPAGEKIFRGWIGEYPVRVTLRRGPGGELSGAYFYEGRGGGELTLKGKVDAGGAFTLEEYDGAKRTGVFKGQWRERAYEPEARIEGDWKRPGGDGGQSFTLEEELAAGPRVTSKRLKEDDKRLRFTVEAVYPQVSGADGFNRLVAGLVTKEVDEFKKGPLEAPPARAPFNSLTINYSMRLVTDDLLSAQFTTARYEHGMAHHSYSLQSVNYDAKAGRRLQLADLFKPGSNYLERISAAAVRALRQINKDDGDSYLQDPDYVANAGPKEENYRNWTLTPRGLAVQFEPYQVGPFAAGSPSVLVPYAELKEVVRPGGPLSSLSK